MADKLTSFAWRHSKRDQVLIIVLTVTSFPIMWVTLELPKRIINDAIGGQNFPRVVLGFELEQVQYLLALCFAYLGAVAGNNALKYILNMTRGLTGERMLRRMRFDLFRRVMGRPLHRLRATNPGELVQMISAELSPIGDFIGAIFATPLMAGGQFIVYLGFIIAQNALIGAAALLLYPVQAYIIPKLQSRVVEMIKARLANVRAMAREINQSIDGAAEIRALRTRRWHMAVVSRQLYDNFVIRKRLFILKFLIKFLNNVADHVTPFFIFVIGGYFVIEGRLDLGALTAVLIAYKNLSAPWKELLRYYQDISDISARYQDVMDQFRDDEAAAELPDTAPVGPHAVALHQARIEDFSRPLTCSVPPGSITAVSAEDAALRSSLLQALSGISSLRGGTWTSLQPRLYRSAVLVTADSRAFSGSFRSNMLQGLRFRPVAPATDPEAETRRREALATGAPEDDIEAVWIDPKDAGYEDMQEVEDRMLDLAHKLELDDDLYVIGLGSHADPRVYPDLTDTLLQLRKAIASSAELGAMREDFIDVWTPDRYNPNGTVGENLFFARPVDPEKRWADYADDREVYRAIESNGLREVLVDIGLDLCETLISLFEGVAGDSDLLREYGLFPKSETPHIEAILRKARRRGQRRLNRSDAQRMIAIAFDYCSARYRLSVMRAQKRENVIVAARGKMRRALKDDPRFAFFDEDRYIAPFSLSENIFFGPVRVDRRDSWRPFKDRIDVLARETGLREDILRLGLDQPVGDGGVTLNARQRVGLALARGLMKNPAAMLLDRIAGGADETDRRLRATLHQELKGGALVYGIARSEAADGADKVIWVADRGGGDVREGSVEEFTRLDAGETEG